MTEDQIRKQIDKIETKLWNLQNKANSLDETMQDHWGFEENVQARRVWGKIHRCNNRILELTVKKTDLYKRLG